jgi:hypothetical protein
VRDSCLLYNPCATFLLLLPCLLIIVPNRRIPRRRLLLLTAVACCVYYLTCTLCMHAFWRACYCGIYLLLLLLVCLRLL